MLPEQIINRRLSSTPAKVSVALLISLLSTTLMPASPTYAAPAVTVTWNDVHQTIDGFGASGAFGQANSLKNMSEPARTTILDALFSQTSGAGLSIVRNIVNDGRSGTTIEPSLNTWVWTGDTDQIWLMQQAQNRGETRFISTVWSPPAWMKDNGSAVGGSLAASHYQGFADYLSRYAREYNSRFGLPIYVVSLANEPGVSVSYSSCNWTGVQFHDFIKNNLLPTFQTDGVTAKVMIPEKAQWDETLANESLADEVTAARVDIVGGHDYDATIPRTITPFTNALSHNKPVWETEVSYFTANVSNITDGLKWATEVHNFMVADTSAFLYWWLMEGDRSDGEALVQISGSSYTLNKRLYTLGNYARFVRPDYVRIGSTANPATNIFTTAYRDPASSKLVLVVINNNASSQTIDIVPDGFSASSLTPYITDATRNLVQLSGVSLSGVTLAASSVTTFVGTASTIPATCYGLTLSHTGNGSDPTASPLKSTACTTAGQYVEGESITLTATPDPGWQISSWTGTNGASSNILTMPASARAASVLYTAIEYTLTASGDGHGSVTLNPAGGTYASGTTVTLTPEPASGYSFSGWGGANSGDIINTSGVYTIVMNGNKSVTANFVAQSVVSTAAPSDATPTVGQQIVVSINIDMSGVAAPDNKLGSFTGSLDWDPAILTYSSNSGLLGGFTGAVNTVNVATGHIAFNGANATGATGNVVVFQITFNAVGAGTSALNLEYTAMATAYTFTGLLPVLTVTDGQVVVSPAALGNVNGDGLVDSTDALIILSADVGMDTSQFCPMNCGDANGDGPVDSTDALIILSYDVGMTVPYAVGTGACPSTVTQPAGCTP